MNQTLPISDTLLWEALPDLTLNIAQTASLCGISVRQLGYWTRQGYVAAQGHGVRRTYGLDAVRRVLAIRKAMDAGASLRQALRQVGTDILPSDPPYPSPPPFQDVPAPIPSSFVSSLSAREFETLARSLRALFETNRQTRDDAAGLSVKLGRAENDVRVVAEDLCTAGVLLRSVCQDTIIFQYGDQEAAHA